MASQQPPSLEFSSFAEVYEKLLVGPLFRPWAELLLERLAPKPGERVLDVACGTGIVSRLARERVGAEGRVIGVDLSPQMLSVAQSIAPEIEWREGNATALPVDREERFDIVTCHQGLQFVQDRPRAAGEMRRALAAGGRAGIATWRPAEEMPLLLSFQRIVERHVGPVVDARHGFGDDRHLEALLVEAGFQDVEVEVVSLPIRFADGPVFVRLNATALLGMSARGKQLTDEERAGTLARIVQETEEELSPYGPGGEFTFEIRSNVALGRG